MARGGIGDRTPVEAPMLIPGQALALSSKRVLELSSHKELDPVGPETGSTTMVPLSSDPLQPSATPCGRRLPVTASGPSSDRQGLPRRPPGSFRYRRRVVANTQRSLRSPPESSLPWAVIGYSGSGPPTEAPSTERELPKVSIPSSRRASDRDRHPD